jgi:type II restriction enzyme
MQTDFTDIFKQWRTSYNSNSQLIRVVSEEWFSTQMFCPSCTNDRLESLPNNSKAADFICASCNETYQLKSKKLALGRKIVDGHYDTMHNAITEGRAPNFCFMTYDLNNLSITNLLLVPRFFINLPIIEKRKPLSIAARRAGWTGCNILFQEISDRGKLFVVEKQTVASAEDVRIRWSKIRFLQDYDDYNARSWITDILYCIDLVKKEYFNLQEMYQFEAYLASRHPLNNNIRPKIRQQLQVLRDRGVIDFVGRGEYQVR